MRRLQLAAAATSLVMAAAARNAHAADAEATPPGTTPPPSAPSYPTKAAAQTPPPQGGLEGFSFGSYGRISAASDLRGGSGREANIVAYGTRLDAPTYAEVQLERRDKWPSTYGLGYVSTNIVYTQAFAAPLFHETGKFEAKTAIRNLYAETKGIFNKGFSAWIGSRMYRGDDVYLLNFWPLDNLNMVGGGTKLAIDTTSEEATSLALAVGIGRANDPFSFQTRPSSSPTGFGSVDVVTLDRPRTIVSLKAQHLHFFKRGSGAIPGLKFVLYGEQHAMARGTRVNESNLREELPAEQGTVLGGQIGMFAGEHDIFINLFLRHATGLAAYGDKTMPTALSPEKTTLGARETLVALSANYEKGPFALLVGGYFRGFRDASRNPYSRSTFNEGAIDVRPVVWVGEHVGVAADVSYQALATAAVRDDGTPERASMWRFGFVPFLTPGGRGSFTRPHFNLIYLYSVRDQGAQLRYAPDDKFAKRGNEHYLGMSVEWWFNSSYR